jgi:hypothetical protein
VFAERLAAKGVRFESDDADGNLLSLTQFRDCARPQ